MPRIARLLAPVLTTAIAFGLLGAASATAAYDPADPVQKAAYDDALSVGAQAYLYGLPLVDMDRTYRTSTSVNVSSGRGGGPVNQFNHFRKLADARDRTVVIPNHDTLYSMAWLDLRKGPVVIHSAKGTKRFHVFEILSPYTENFVNIGSPRTALPDGDYLMTGPGFRGRTPRGLTRIRSPYDLAWVIGRTEIFGPSDAKATHRVQDTYKITPLANWRRDRPYGYTPPRPKVIDRTTDHAHIPGTAPGEDPATYFDAVGDQLKRFPPPKADAPILATMKRLGIGAGLRPSSSGALSDAQRQGLRDAVTQGPGRIQAELVRRYLAGFEAHNGWLVGRVGRYGTDYMLRALADKYGLGAPVPQVSVYPLSILDRNRQGLTGAKRYVAHFAPGTVPPPVRFFWSLTMYDNDGFLVDNPLDRYVVNDRSRLNRNTDGSLDIYIQAAEPTDPAQRANWLPSPSGTSAQPGFRLMVRLYGLSEAGIDGVISGSGWQAPAILPCDDTGRTATGIACAR